MFKPLLTGCSVLVLMFTATPPAKAEPPEQEPQLLTPNTQPSWPIMQSPASTTLPHLSDGNLSEYAATDSVPILQRGSQGLVVEDVQKFLKQAGIYTGAVDGIFGPQSEAAVAQFQVLAKLSPDGVVGFQTWEAMIRSQAG